MINQSLLKEFVNQADLKKSDGSDAGASDVVNKATTTDVKFSLMRNTINSDGKVSGSDVANYLEKAADINDEVDTVLYGLETDDGEVVKVYVNATQADAFEAEMKKMLGMEDDIEAAINELATKFDIIDVIWPKAANDDSEESEDEDLNLDSTANLGDASAPSTDDDSDMEVIASIDDTPPKKAADEEPPKEKKTKGDDTHGKLKNVGKNMKIKESRLQVGWYVYDKNDKTVAGPVEEAEAKRICKEKGGDAKGFITGYVSDYDARRANETQGDNMTIGNKFLQRVLAEDKGDASKEDRDGVMDGFNIPLDAQQRSMAAKLKWKLPKQIIALFAMVGIPGIKLNSAGAKDSVEDAAQILRTQISIRRAFLDFYKAYAEATGRVIDKEPAAEPVTEARLKRGSYLQKQLETVLIHLGLPEELIVTTGPGVVGIALFRAAKLIEDNADLKAKLRMLAIRMGIKPAETMAPLDDAAITEVQLARTDMKGNVNLGTNQDAKAVANLLRALGLNQLVSAMDSMYAKRAGGYKLPNSNLRSQVVRLANMLDSSNPSGELAQGVEPMAGTK